MSEWRDLEEEQMQKNGRSPLLVLLGLVCIGLALALFLYGSDLIGRQPTTYQAINLPQIPDADADSGIASIASDTNLLQVGDTAYDFQLQDLDGKNIALSDFQGQPVILNFWATWCPPCRMEMPELQAAYEKYKDDGLVILALDQAESATTVRSFFYDQFGLTFTPVLDSDQAVATQYGVFNYPSSIFINGEGVITAIHRGALLESQIDSYLADTIQ